jgi:hypothetical protein
MNKILFRIEGEQFAIRFGDLISVIRGCYFKGKELGFEDNNIYLEWPKNVRYTTKQHFKYHLSHDIDAEYTKCPIDTILPIKFIENPILEDYNNIIDLNKSNCMYDGCPPIFTPNDDRKKNFQIFWSYTNKYYLETGVRPIFNLGKDKSIEPYILVHDRRGLLGTVRNPKPEVTLGILKYLKRKYGNKYKIYRCGESIEDEIIKIEQYSKSIENFKRTLDYTIFTQIENLTDEFITNKDISEFIKIVNNCSMFVGPNSGPYELALSLNIPVLHFDNKKVFFASIKKEGDIYSEFNWTNNMHGQIGKVMHDWIDRDRLYVHNNGDHFITPQLNNFLDKWLINE